MPKIEYRKEFFDRDYTALSAYKRVWKYARKYKFRLFIGIVSGMITASTLVPFFQIVQPALQHVESHDRGVVTDRTDRGETTSPPVAVADGGNGAAALRRLMSDVALCRRLGENARRFCAERYSREHILDQWENLLAQLK